MEAIRKEQMSYTPETEGGRRPTGVSGVGTKLSDTEVEVRKTRRRLTVGYKLRVIETVNELKASGGSSIGSYLRKEGLYYSAVQKWIHQQEHGKLTSANSGGKTKSRADLQAEIHRLRRQLERAEKKLKKTELIVDLQKKLSLVLGLDQAEIDEKKLER